MNNSERTRVVMYCNGEVLILRARLNRGKWMLPGGGIKRNEPAHAAAVREIREEIGIDIDAAMLRKVGKSLENSSKIKLKLTFYAVELETKPALSLHKIEIAEAKWVKLSELSLTPMVEYERDVVLRLIQNS